MPQGKQTKYGWKWFRNKRFRRQTKIEPDLGDIMEATWPIFSFVPLARWIFICMYTFSSRQNRLWEFPSCDNGIGFSCRCTVWIIVHVHSNILH
jgi:hypothetical protein